jgi:hypothetical protein
MAEKPTILDFFYSLNALHMGILGALYQRVKFPP